MKPFPLLLTIGAAAASLICPRTVNADDTTPPIVVPQDRDDRDLLQDLKGVPAPVKTLIVNFDQTRDQYLRQQHLLLIKLHKATTPEEREAIRDLLKANREAMMQQFK